MEGHEPSDWSSYYAEPEVGTRLCRGKRGGGVRSRPQPLDRFPGRPPAPTPAAPGSRLFHPPSTQMGLFFIRHTVSLEIILTL